MLLHLTVGLIYFERADRPTKYPLLGMGKSFGGRGLNIASEEFADDKHCVDI